MCLNVGGTASCLCRQTFLAENPKGGLSGGFLGVPDWVLGYSRKPLRPMGESEPSYEGSVLGSGFF